MSLDLPQRQSAFLREARKTGKSTLLQTAFPQSLAYDFLKTDLALSFGASDDRELRSLALFCETHRPRLAVVVCNESEERIVGGVRILPWRLFIEELWNGRLISG